MHSSKALIGAMASASLFSAALSAGEFSGAAALEATGRLTAIGTRVAGSAGGKQAQARILASLKAYKCKVTEDAFNGLSPTGPVAMKNILAEFPGTSGRMIVITGHYDTKLLPKFVGANDGGSSAGFLLEMARALNGMPRKDTVMLAWFDGEEAFKDWTESDSLYGSRHLADKWRKDGTLSRVRGLINVDMIGDKDLGILKEYQSRSPLRELIWRTASDRGYGKYFLDREQSTDDDHMPFLRAGVQAVDLIDFDYGPDNAYWHTPGDTMDKLSANSLQVVGNVLMEVIARLEGQ